MYILGEGLTVFLLTGCLLVINCLGYIVGYMRQSTDSVFLGTVQWPGDYFYYVSQFAQGKTSWLFSHNLYTNDFSAPVLVGWVNVFLGRLFWLAGGSAIHAYAGSLFLSTIAFGLVSYGFIRLIFPGKDRQAIWQRLISFVIFCTSNGVPGIMKKGNTLSLDYFEYWFNNGAILNRVNPVPHQMIAKTAAIGGLALSLLWQRTTSLYRRLGIILGLGISGLLCASIEPVQWAMTTGILGLVALWQWRQRDSRSLVSLIPALCFGLGGLPMALYLNYLFAIPPYTQLSLWEMSQNVSIPFFLFLRCSGPALILGSIGLWHLRSQKTYHARLLIIGSIIPLLLFFSPLPSWIGIVNVRFVPTFVFLCFACASAVTLTRIQQQKHGHLLMGLLMVLSLCLSFPSLRYSINDRLSRVEPQNALYYLPPTAIDMAAYIAQHVPEDATIVSVWPHTISLPALTARRVYTGHALLTLNAVKKDQEAYGFLDGKLAVKDAETFLRREHITHVLSYPWMPGVQNAPFLEVVHTNGYLSLYQVK